MIKVTISYKNDGERYGSDDTFLVDTANHPIALLTALQAFNGKPEIGSVAIVNTYTKVDDDVIQPSIAATDAVASVY